MKEMYEEILKKINNKEDLTNEEFTFLKDRFGIYDGLMEENINLIVVDLGDILYAFRMNGSEDNPVYLEQPYRVQLVSKDGEIYVTQQLVH